MVCEADGWREEEGTVWAGGQGAVSDLISLLDILLDTLLDILLILLLTVFI